MNGQKGDDAIVGLKMLVPDPEQSGKSLGTADPSRKTAMHNPCTFDAQPMRMNVSRTSLIRPVANRKAP
ncbi:hypothetical protein J1C49_02095 [Cognatishimia sp. F0-27]|nr:hypothetical protein [Cognatishimia sp. F0-27]